jgi:hypothetical protein
MQFVLTDDLAGSFDRAIRKTYKPRGRLTERGHEVQPPDMVKQQVMREVRAEVRTTCAGFIAENLPGAFSTILGRERLPAGQLILTEKMEPFSEMRTAGRGYEWVSGLEGSFDTWQSGELPGLRARFGGHFDEEPDVVTIAGQRADALSDPNLARFGSNQDPVWALTQHLYWQLHETLALWGLLMLLVALQQRLADARDLVRPSTTRAGPTLKYLKRVRSELLRDSMDARAAAEDTLGLCKRGRAFESDATDFHPVTKTRGDRTLLTGLRSSLSMRARQLLATERFVRDFLLADGNAVSALANLRIQKRLLPLTVAAVAFAGVTLVLALRS